MHPLHSIGFSMGEYAQVLPTVWILSVLIYWVPNLTEPKWETSSILGFFICFNDCWVNIVWQRVFESIVPTCQTFLHEIWSLNKIKLVCLHMWPFFFFLAKLAYWLGVIQSTWRTSNWSQGMCVMLRCQLHSTMCVGAFVIIIHCSLHNHCNCALWTLMSSK